MRFSVVLFLCLVIVVVNSTTTKTTRRRRLVVTTGRSTTKAPAPKSAYAYLRTVRGKNSCAGGSCPFWERHGRSFAALRCYSRQYQECTCLHRMCFSSCMFSRDVCNQEMVSCLQQICPRCMPASASAMCAIYDSMAERVALALSVFACYPCCPNMNSASTNSTSGSFTTIPAISESSSTVPPDITDDVFGQSTTLNPTEGEFYPSGENQPSTNVAPGTNQNPVSFPANNVNSGVNTNVFSNGNTITNSNGNPNPNTNTYSSTNGNGYFNGNNNIYSNTNGNGIPNTNVNPNSNPNSISNGNLNGNGNSNPVGNVNSATASNSISNGNGIGNSGNCNLANNYPGVVFPGSDAMFYNNNFPNRNQQVLKQRGRPTIRTTKRRSTTTRRTPVTTRRTAQASVTVRGGSNVKSGVRKPVQVDKKPQTNNHIKS